MGNDDFGLDDDRDADERNDDDQPDSQRDPESDPQPETKPIDEAQIGVGRQPSDKPRRERKPRASRARGTIPERAKDNVPRAADLLWMNVLERLDAGKIGVDQISIRVARLDVGHETTLGWIPGEAVEGDHSQGAAIALVEHIVQRFHLRQPERRGLGATQDITYKVQFVLRGQTYDTGTLKLPPPEQSRGEQFERQQFYPQPTQGFGAPAPYYPYYPPPPQQPPPQPPPRATRSQGEPQGYGHPHGFGAPPHQQPYPQHPQYPPYGYAPNPEMQEMREQIRSLTQIVKDVVTRGAQPQAPAVPPGMTLEQLAELKETLEPLGLVLSVKGANGAVGVGAPAPAPAPPPEEKTDLAKTIEKTLTAALKKNADKFLNELVTGKRADDDEDEEEEEEESPEADFEMVDVPGGVTWPGTTQPMRYARDRETGKIHWFGTALGNPSMIDKYGGKAIDVVGKLADAIKDGTGLGKPRELPQEQRQQMNGGHSPPQPPQAPPQASPPAPARDDDDGFGL